jgi:uncharacterized membrane protein YbjE (DUF340 family)
MTTVLLLMLAGICIGFAIHRYPAIIRINEKLITWAIYLLLFLLGISVGLNKTIIQNLNKIGLQAITITIGAITGSVLTLWLIYRLFFHVGQNTGGPDEE